MAIRNGSAPVPGHRHDRRTGAAAILAGVALIVAAPAAAQIVPIRTVPVSQAHQFDLFPSHTAGMGGVAIAVTDSLLDPFRNPARGAGVGATRFFGTPAAYSVSSDAGGGRTLPLGALTRAGPWTAGFLLALQEVDAGLAGAVQLPLPACPACLTQGFDPAAAPRTHGNRYVFAMASRTLADRGASVGGSILWSGLNAVDGVDLLYAGSARIRQSGHALDLRLGVTRAYGPDRTLEAVVVHDRLDMTHDVLYLDWFWDPGTQGTAARPRVERNQDRTNTWGLHVAYRHPLTADGWHAGWTATANYKTHPKIPNYEIMNIPRDPGSSAAFNLGAGVARVHGGSTVALDIVYEPIRSHTWADAEEPVETRRGGTIPAGGMTIENRFRFANAKLRLGIGDEFALDDAGRMIGVQLGLAVHSIGYRLDQTDHVQVSERSQHERWTEWSPTWGLSLRLPALELRYRGSALNGTGRPGVAQRFVAVPGRLDAAGINILAAPSGPLTLDEVRVLSHQVSLALPLR
jgi:hypothetical protein